MKRQLRVSVRIVVLAVALILGPLSCSAAYLIGKFTVHDFFYSTAYEHVGWSADGAYVTAERLTTARRWQVRRVTHSEPVRFPVGGGAAETIPASALAPEPEPYPGFGAPVATSADGRWEALVDLGSGSSDPDDLIVRRPGSTSTQPLFTGRLAPLGAAFAPDSTQIALFGNVWVDDPMPGANKGPWGLMVLTVPGGTPRLQIDVEQWATLDRITEFAWAPGSNGLAFVGGERGDRTAIWLVEINTRRVACFVGCGESPDIALGFVLLGLGWGGSAVLVGVYVWLRFGGAREDRGKPKPKKKKQQKNV